MKQLTLTLDDATFHSAEVQARKAGKPLTAVVVEWVRRFSSAGDSDFDRLEAEEAALHQQGRPFSAGDRLTRDELYHRDAVR